MSTHGIALPHSWSEVAIDDIGCISGGGTPNTSDPRYWENGTIPWVSPKDMKTLEIADAQDKITEVAVVETSTKLVPPGTVLIVIRSGILQRTLPVGLATCRVALNQDLKGIVPHSSYSPRYVAYALIANESRILRECCKDGTTVQSIEIPSLRRLTVPIAPAAEQVRIADHIDELFTELSAGVAALERVRRKLTRYRSALLHAAVTGKLHTSTTPTWASESNWRCLGEIINEIEQGWSPKCDRDPAANSEQWAVMTTTAIQPMAFDGHENKKLPATLNPYTDLELRVGDILITRAGPRRRAGIACLVRKTRQRLLLCDKAYRFRCKADQATGEYIEIVLNARPITDAIERMKTGSSDSGLNLTQSRFRSLAVPIPPIDEQNEIVELVQEKLSHIDAMEAEVERGLARASRLRQAILKSAFAGKLVPQDPNDEPAAALLVRIKAERAQQDAASNGRVEQTTTKKAVRKRVPAKTSRATKPSSKRKQK